MMQGMRTRMGCILLVVMMGYLTNSIKMPVEQGEFRCMLIYSMGGDDTIKIDILFPQLGVTEYSENQPHYHLTLRNTKTHETQSQKIYYGHFRREISVYEKIIYEICFEIVSPYEIPSEVLVDYHAQTHYLYENSEIKVPENLLKLEHMQELYKTASKVNFLSAKYQEMYYERNKKEQQQFANTQNSQYEIMAMSIVQIVALSAFGIYQFANLRKKFQQSIL